MARPCCVPNCLHPGIVSPVSDVRDGKQITFTLHAKRLPARLQLLPQRENTDNKVYFMFHCSILQ